jgi:hypothetical protein
MIHLDFIPQVWILPDVRFDILDFQRTLTESIPANPSTIAITLPDCSLRELDHSDMPFEATLTSSLRYQ